MHKETKRSGKIRNIQISRASEGLLEKNKEEKTNMLSLLAKSQGHDATSVDVKPFFALVPIPWLAISSHISAKIVFGKDLFGVVEDFAVNVHLGGGTPRQDESVEVRRGKA